MTIGDRFVTFIPDVEHVVARRTAGGIVWAQRIDQTQAAAEERRRTEYVSWDHLTQREQGSILERIAPKA